MQLEARLEEENPSQPEHGKCHHHQDLSVVSKQTINEDRRIILAWYFQRRVATKKEALWAKIQSRALKSYL